MSPLYLLISLSTFLTVLIPSTHSIAVMSIDLGSEWMKIGIISPGVPMEIVLNKESKRKTPAIVSFRDNVRTFGEDAQTIAIRFPKNSYSYLLDLLAKDINNPIVKLYQQRFPHYEIIEDPERNTILFKHDGGDILYSPEELVAQFLHKAKEFTEMFAGQPVNEVVLTVPGFFNQAERKSLMQAANLAGLKVLQLINDYTAVALNYGIFRQKDMNETATYVMFYDMGASKTTATIVSYQTVKIKERGTVETHPQISVLGVGYDRTLGGLEIQLRLRDYLATKFNELKKTKSDVLENARAMNKLFKEAGRLKNVLSANTEHVAQVEGLLDEVDFRISVKREELEALCADLFARVKYPVEQALRTSHLSLDLISQVVLVGAGTRVPKIQEEIQKAVNMDLSKNLNTDEAAAIGAVYRAADLSTGFKVKKYITKDAVLFPIQVTFQKVDDTVHTDDTPMFENAASIGGKQDSKRVKRTLFGLMNPYPQKKIITFNRHSHDFTFNINYDGLDYLPEIEARSLGVKNLSLVRLEGVADALDKNKGDNVESKGVKAHFQLDDSGILSLANVEFVFEKTVSVEEQQKEQADEESPLSKLGNTISKLFTSSGSTDVPPPPPPPHREEEAEEEEAKTSKEDSAKTAKVETSKNETTKSGKDVKDVKDLKPKLVTIKAPLKTQETILGVPQLSEKQVEKSLEMLEALNEIDRAQTRRETALNNLESFVIDALQKLGTDEFTKASTDKEVEKIRKKCNDISEWLYEDGSDADADTYETKHADLKQLTRDLYSRVWEHKERPDALNALDGMITGAQGFFNSAKNLTKAVNPEKDVFTDVELQTLDKVIRETIDWKNKTEADQKKLKKSEPVVLSVKMVTEKMQLLDREVKYLVNKLKIWRPKTKDIPVKEDAEKANKTGDKTAKNEEKEETKTEEDQQEQPQQQQQQQQQEEEGGEEEDEGEIVLDPTNSEEDTHTEL